MSAPVTPRIQVLLGVDIQTKQNYVNDCACVASPACQDICVPDRFPGVRQLIQAREARTFQVDGRNTILLPTSSSRGAAVLNREALELWAGFAQPSTILEKTSAVNDQHQRNEVTHAIRELWRGGYLERPRSTSFQTIRPDHLDAWIHVTDRCNLRCSYCFLPHRKVDMPEEVGHDVINASLRAALSQGYSQVKLKYAGGEPTLRMDFVERLHLHAQEKFTQQSVALRGVVLTNGTLLNDDVLRRISRARLELMISIDGLSFSNDRQRIAPRGVGTAAKIRQAIDKALDARIVPCISITVTPESAEALPQLIEWILARDLEFSINFYRETPGARPHTDIEREERKLVASLHAMYDVLEHRLPNRSLLDSIADRTSLSLPHHHACGAGINYLVFNTDGSIAKCHMLLDQPTTTYTDLNPLATLRSKSDGFENLPVEERDDCAVCEWREWCAGGCPLLTLRVAGSSKAKSPYCRIYREILPRVIRLEGLRILKYASSDSGPHQPSAAM